ncbi:hypothetical protein CT19431_MP30376 [Cupriavidus taiwanensis]|nr:hypothetical protein CT19431_MP30376 [Cupriavidus taiwanensis]
MPSPGRGNPRDVGCFEPGANLPPRPGQHTDSVLGDGLHMKAQQPGALYSSEFT